MKTVTLAFPLYLVRHGETDWNAEGRLQGGQDIALNDRGRRQAAEAAERLQQLAFEPDGFAFVCSPMARAQETMRILQSRLATDSGAFETVETLREITFGRWEGLTWREVRRMEPEKARQRERDKWLYVPPDGESYAMLTERIRPWLENLKGPTLAVSHGGVARAILALTGLVNPVEAASVDIWQGRVMIIEKGRFRWV
jgi:probable phosphoglycerate mutase